MFALLLFAQVTTVATAATCRATTDPQQRVWLLERVAPSGWRVTFTSRALDQPRVELPLANAQPAITPSTIRLVFASANGGRSIDWTIRNGASTLDLRVSHGLEVNVERDLDPAVDSMNTDGPINLDCAITAGSRGPFDFAQDRPKAESVNAEWTIAAGVARSVSLFESTSGRAYAVQTVGYSRELTRELAPGPFRGRFAWGIEVTPVFAQFSPTNIYGVGIAPVVWRWDFVPQPSWSAFAELSMGGLWTTDPIPEETGRVNFTAHWGGGVRLRPRGGNALLLAYRFQHFSNGNQLGSNPGVNSHVFLAGWSHRS